MSTQNMVSVLESSLGKAEDYTLGSETPIQLIKISIILNWGPSSLLWQKLHSRKNRF